MRNSKLFISVSIVILILLTNSFYLLYEGKQAIITQFGKPVGKPVLRAGLHMKLPFIQKVNYFEKRILEWDGNPNQIPTKDKKYIWVDTTARWRIKEPLIFFQSVHDEISAQARLDDILDAAVRDAITSHKLISVVRSSNRISELALRNQLPGAIKEGLIEKIQKGREEIRKEIVEKARELTPQYGIELLDVRIKRINYVEGVRNKVYERMIAERKRAAEKYRSEGRGIKAEIEGKTEKELKTIRSEAYKKAQKIKGEADAKATRIYAEAYNADVDFFSFLNTLKTYLNTVDENTTVIFTTEGEYFNYLKKSTSFSDK